MMATRQIAQAARVRRLVVGVRGGTGAKDIANRAGCRGLVEADAPTVARDAQKPELVGTEGAGVVRIQRFQGGGVRVAIAILKPCGNQGERGLDEVEKLGGG